MDDLCVMLEMCTLVSTVFSRYLSLIFLFGTELPQMG
jgi:hypothetical protein